MRVLLLWIFCGSAVIAATRDGAAVYSQHCASCHDTGAARVPSRTAMSGFSTRRIVNSLESGIMFMPGRRLTPGERRSVATYLTGKPYEVGKAAAGQNPCGTGVAAPSAKAAWSGWSPTLDNSRFADRGGLTAKDLPRLKLRWAFGFPDEVIAFSQPAVSGSRIFVGSASGTVYSLDLASGCEHWRFEADAAVRTAVIADRGRIWFGDLHANVYGVDARTGKLLWKRNLDQHPSARITAAPALHNGRLYVPVSSFEEGMASMKEYVCCTFRGSVVALSADSGRVIWRRFTVDRPAAPVGRNASGFSQRGPSGAAIWSTPTVDPKRGLVYITTGDNYSEPGTALSDAVIALRLASGTVAWSQQVTANDRWNAACLGDKVNCPQDAGPDHDFGAPAILAVAPNGRDLLVAAQKSGMVYGLNPDAKGAILWKTAAGSGGPLGGIQWGHAADREQVYAPISDVQLADMTNTGGGLVALKLSDGTVSWKAAPASCEGRSTCSPAQMAAATVIPGAVISGARDGVYRAYATSGGSVLWSFDTFRNFDTVNGVPARGGSIDGPGPVVAEGMLLMNSGYSLWNGRGGNVLLAFSAEPATRHLTQAPKTHAPKQ